MTDDHLHVADQLPPDPHAIIERQADQIAKLKGAFGYYVSQVAPDSFWGHYDAGKIEQGLRGEVRVVFDNEGGVTFMTGMGS